MLASYGVQISPTLVMDPQNEPFPVQVARNVGGMTVQEIQAVNFPFFPDIRSNAMDRSQPIVSQLPAVTMNFASPVTLDRNQECESHDLGVVEVQSQRVADQQHADRAKLPTVSADRLRH